MKKVLLITGILIFATSLYSQIIVEIEVGGNELVDKALITAASGLAIGKDFTSESTKNSIKKLYTLGLFEDIRITTEQKGGGIKLIIQVDEYPKASIVEFIGNKKIKDKDLSDICDIKEGSITSSRLIFNGKVSILEAYRDKGQFLVEVDSKTELTEDGMIIRYFITEKANLRIKKIEIIGNNAFPDGAIKAKLNNKEKGWWFIRRGIFDEDKFIEDMDKIKDFYAQRGYPNVEIKNVEFVELGDNWIRIEITLDEGKCLYFGDITITGNTVFPEERLYSIIKSKKGNIYNINKLDETTQALYEIYGDMGYLYLHMNVEEKLNDSIVNITYNINEGNPAKVHYMLVKGNNKTHEKVIRRELTLFPGDILRRNELIRSQRNVFNLGFFENLTLDTRVVNDKGDIDLTFNVEEKQAGQFNIGISYAAETKLYGNISISIPNLRGRGELIYFKIDKGGKFANYELGFREPWLFDTPLTVGLHLYSLEIDKPTFGERRTGGRIDVSRLIPKLAYTYGYASYELENLFITADSSAPQSIIDEAGERWKSAITLGIRRDSRDNFMNPKEGSKNSARIEIAGLGGTVRFQKFIFESQVYNTLPLNFATLVRGKFGVINPPDAPTYERFILGGVGVWGIRGYPDLSIGVFEGGKVIGGRYALLFTIEAKISFKQNIYPIVFMDLGNTWTNLEEINLRDMKRGLGFGIRMEVPLMGLLGFDFAYGEDGWVPHFQVGKEF